jgi:hypothetical protein
MGNLLSIRQIEKLLTKSEEVKVESSDDSTFKVWKSSVERALIKIYGENSFELKEFKKLKFYYAPIMWNLGDDFTREHLQVFRKDFQHSIRLLQSYVDDLKENVDESVPEKAVAADVTHSLSKVFISHASKDKKIVEEIIELLETIGLDSQQIFCSSFEGYGIDLGENFLDRIKAELNDNVLVIFVLTHEFYQSPVCLCEMGASWVKTNDHIPIIVPPLDYKDVKGVIPLTQGLKITEALQFNLLKQKLEKNFQLKPIDLSSWERKRDRIIGRINEYISATK